MFKVVKTKIPLYYTSLWLIYTDDVQEVNKLIGSEYETLDFIALSCEGVLNKNNSFILSVIFNSELVEKNDISLISHESFHITGMVAKRHGLKYDVENDESFAYLTGEISKILYNFLKNN